MKVCLINPILFSSQRLRGRTMRNNRGMSYYPPLGLCYIASVLERNGIKVTIIDRHALMSKHDENLDVVDHMTKREIERLHPDIVGITSATATYYDVTTTLLPLVRSAAGDVRIVLGGSHGSALPEEVLSSEHNIDIVCRGEGEFVMLDIAQDKPLQDIAGISYRDGEVIRSNEPRIPHADIDDFCFPARHLVDMEYYCQPNPVVMHGLYMRATTIFASRGCAFNCTFCAGKVTSGRKVRYQSPDLVIEEIERLVTDYGIEGIYFADDMFDVDRNRADTICEKLIAAGLNKRVCIYPQLRANTIEKKRLQLLKRAGVRRVDIGFESGSQRILDAMNKCTTVEQNYRAAQLLHEVGLQFQANIMVGFPGENRDDLKQTEKLMRCTKPHWINFGEFLPLPGSPIYNDLKDRNVIRPEMLEYTKAYNLTEMDDETFERLIAKMRKEIVLPTRIKSYLYHNRRKPMAYAYLAKLVVGAMKSRLSSS